MIELHDFFARQRAFPRLETESGSSFVQYRNYQSVRRNQVWSKQHFCVLVINGNKRIYTGQAVLDLHAGQAAFLRRGGYLMSEILAGEAPFESFVLFFDDDFLLRFATQNRDLMPFPEASRPKSVVLPLGERLQYVINALSTHFRHPLPRGGQRLLDLHLQELLLSLLLYDSNQRFGQLLALILREEDWSLENIMEENFNHRLSLPDFARLCGCSLSTFKRQFHRKYGISPGKWLLERRLQYAKLLLQTSSQSVTAIAQEAGFENPSHFSQAFRRRYAMPPQRMRKSRPMAH